eukprot:1952638-Rhodomonas_salina.1
MGTPRTLSETPRVAHEPSAIVARKPQRPQTARASLPSQAPGARRISGDARHNNVGTAPNSTRTAGDPRSRALSEAKAGGFAADQDKEDESQN